MKFSKATFVTAVVASLLAGGFTPLALKATEAQLRSPIRLATPARTSTQPVEDAGDRNIQAEKLLLKVPSREEMLAQQVNDLADRLAALELKVSQQQAALDHTNERISARPAGYHQAFITLTNFSHLPGTDAITYWARD